MNPIIITTTSALAGFILSIFTASWLNQRHIEKLMEQQDQKIGAQIEALRADIRRNTEVTQANFTTLEERFKGVDHRFSALEQRLDRIERQLDQIFKPTLPRT